MTRLYLVRIAAVPLPPFPLPRFPSFSFSVFLCLYHIIYLPPQWLPAISSPGLGTCRSVHSANGEQDLPSYVILIIDNIFFVIFRLNTKLEANGYPTMSSLVKDLSDGVRLIQLMVRSYKICLGGTILIYCAGDHGYFGAQCVQRIISDIYCWTGDTSLGRYNKNPRIRVQKAENVNKALEFITSRGVKLTNIGPEGA